MRVNEKYDVIILGGGLAGLTLALQLRQSKPDIHIVVLERRTNSAPIAIHKVGESTSELGSSYLREVLNLKEYLTDHQLPKFGFRFFFSPEHSDDIARRVEVGSRIFQPYPTHQIDRGIFENDLVNRLAGLEVDIHLGAKVKDVVLSKAGHRVHFEKESTQYAIEATWVIDSTGRGSLLKKKLCLEKELGHTINAAWFRLGAEIDMDDWSENLTWRNHADPGRRRLATNHLMGEGYWVWLIPLVSGSTSIGIVADPVFHPFDTFNTFEKAMIWLKRHEPLAAQMLGHHKEKLMDFKVMKNFAYDTKQFYSSDKWALTGEAGAFMDPFYSPGTDFIGLGNSWISDLILRDLKGEDIALRIMIYELVHRELMSGWIHLFRNMYGTFGKTQIMLMKIVWDWASYWAVPCLMFMNKGYTDIAVLKKYSSSASGIGRRFAKLNERMQSLFRAWSQYDIEPVTDHYQNVFDLQCLRHFQTELYQKYELTELMQKVEANLMILENISAEIFRLASAQIHNTPREMRVDPYEMTLDDRREELLRKSNSNGSLAVDESVQSDMERIWLSTVKTNINEYSG